MVRTYDYKGNVIDDHDEVIYATDWVRTGNWHTAPFYDPGSTSPLTVVPGSGFGFTFHPGNQDSSGKPDDEAQDDKSEEPPDPDESSGDVKTPEDDSQESDDQDSEVDGTLDPFIGNSEYIDGDKEFSVRFYGSVYDYENDGSDDEFHFVKGMSGRNAMTNYTTTKLEGKSVEEALIGQILNAAELQAIGKYPGQSQSQYKGIQYAKIVRAEMGDKTYGNWTIKTDDGLIICVKVYTVLATFKEVLQPTR